MEYIEPPFTEGKTKIFIENNGLIPSPLVYALEYKNNNKLIFSLFRVDIFVPIKIMIAVGS